MKEYEEIIREKGLPNVGQTVYSKKYGTFWRVIEKKEVWQNIADDPQTKQPRMVPAIYLCFWRIQEGVLPGIGRMLGYTYTLLDNSCEFNWEILHNHSHSERLARRAQGVAEVLELPLKPRQPKAESEEDREGPVMGGEVINLRLTKKAIYRAAEKEMKQIYRLSAGGADPIVDDASREMFERGEIDEVRWKDWATYCINGFQHY